MEIIEKNQEFILLKVNNFTRMKMLLRNLIKSSLLKVKLLRKKLDLFNN